MPTLQENPLAPPQKEHFAGMLDLETPSAVSEGHRHLMGLQPPPTDLILKPMSGCYKMASTNSMPISGIAKAK
jgi:hypothetical protein